MNQSIEINFICKRDKNEKKMIILGIHDGHDAIVFDKIIVIKKIIISLLFIMFNFKIC